MTMFYDAIPFISSFKNFVDNYDPVTVLAGKYL